MDATDQTALESQRDTNRLRVVQALFERPGSSRTDVARDTGLSRPTVTTLLEELSRAGIVEQRADREDRPQRPAGRPPLQASLAPRAAFAVGLDFGHDHIHAGVCDLSGSLIGHRFAYAEVDSSPEATLDLAHTLVRDVLEDAHVDRRRVIGVGLGVAALIDSAGAAYVEGILPRWAGIEPAVEMEARLGMPVRMENDANVGALGEHMFGAGRGAKDMLYVRLSAGIGSGLILSGRPYRGASGIAGELGHMCVVEDGLLCGRCGNRGCLETIASPVAVAEALERSRGEPVSVERMLALVQAGDRGAVRAVADAGTAVGAAIAAAVNLLNPELVVIGGELADAGAALLDPVTRAIERRAVPPAMTAARVTKGALGERAELLGAVALALADAPHVLARRVAGV